jgi:hypothetical protein
MSLLGFLRREFELPKQAVKGLRWRGFFRETLQIEHAVPGYPPFIAFGFWPSDRGGMQEAEEVLMKLEYGLPKNSRRV